MMKNKWIRLLVCGLLAVGVMAVSVLTVRDLLDRKKYSKGLKSFSYSVGGGMTGGYDRVSVYMNDDGKVIVQYVKARWHNSDPETLDCIVDLSIFEEIQNVINDNKMYQYSHIGKKGYVVFDGETTSASFGYSSSNSFSFSSNQNLKAKHYQALSEVLDVVKRYADQGQRIASMVPTIDDAKDYYKENAAFLHVSQCNLNRISYGLVNHSEQIISAERIELYAEVNGECQLIQSWNHKLNLNPQYNDYGTVEASGEYLSAGRYKLVIGEFEDCFELN